MGLILASIAGGALGGCPRLAGDTRLDGNWTVRVQHVIPGVAEPVFTLAVLNGQPAALAMPFLPAPLDTFTIVLDGIQKDVSGIAVITASGSLTRDGDTVTIILTISLTAQGQTAEGTLTLNGTVSGDTITGTIVATGNLPGIGALASGEATFTMTRG